MSKLKTIIDQSFVEIATNKIRENIVDQINKKRQFSLKFVSPVVFIGDLFDINAFCPINRFEIKSLFE